MKQFILLLLFTGFLFQSCNNKTTEQTLAASFDETKEMEKIMQVIEGETRSFYKRDYESWKNFYIHTHYAFQAWNNGDGTIDAKTGWAAVDSGIGNYIKTYPVEPGGSSHPVVLRKNMITKFYADTVAYLLWDQYNSDQAGKQFQFSKELRLMEKQNGEWKIVNVSAFWDYRNAVPSDNLK
ncbi:hypothetical protein [Agriterribacter sp.]|uniref:hypothetical protein n=1 Tax=Agriterribacter sp. TaxID=2821509 RepID=UPI002C2847EE|nr:hypothetical protein [Agriterribacter sp.]HRO47419.1 hypothetical protein [Agriterribacter sp.]HRQ16580.1 hypothetical protein [Agriterribacter sp.]